MSRLLCRETPLIILTLGALWITTRPALAGEVVVTPPEPQQLVLADVGLRLELPAPWQLQVPAQGPFAAVAQLPPKLALAMLTRTAIASTDSPTQGVDDLLAELPRSFDNYEVLTHERRSVTSTHDADVLEIRGTARGRTLRHTTFLLEGFGERFALTFATEEHQHAALASQFEHIAATLELVGPNLHNARFLDLVKTAPDDLVRLQQTLNDGAEIDGTDSDGFTALTIAIFNRNGPLTKWLLQQGADPGKPEKLASMLPMIASPPIFELLRQRDPSVSARPRPSDPVGLEIQWVSPEAQLFAGITNARLADVEEALKAGADLSAVEPNYRLSALPLTRKLIEEFEQLELDPNRFQKIEQLLVQASSLVPQGT